MAGVPEVLSAMPDVLKNIFGSPITIGAFSAILLNLFLPREPSEIDVFDPDELVEDAVGTNTLSVNIPDYREHDGHRRDALPQPAGADFKADHAASLQTVRPEQCRSCGPAYNKNTRNIPCD